MSREETRLAILRAANAAKARSALKDMKHRKIDLVGCYHDDTIRDYDPPSWMHRSEKQIWLKRRMKILSKGLGVK